MPVQPVIAIERIVYHRERAAGMYAAMPYALAQGDVEVPYLVVQTLLWSVITYWMFGFEATAGVLLALYAMLPACRASMSDSSILMSVEFLLNLCSPAGSGLSIDSLLLIKTLHGISLLMTRLNMAVLPACREVLVVHIVHILDPDVLYIRWPCGYSDRAQPASLVRGLYHLLCAVESVQRRPHHPAASAGAPLLLLPFEVQVDSQRLLC